METDGFRPLRILTHARRISVVLTHSPFLGAPKGLGSISSLLELGISES
jgi:hypothetical protein